MGELVVTAPESSPFSACSPSSKPSPGPEEGKPEVEGGVYWALGLCRPFLNLGPLILSLQF